MPQGFSVLSIYVFVYVRMMGHFLLDTPEPWEKLYSLKNVNFLTITPDLDHWGKVSAPLGLVV